MPIYMKMDGIRGDVTEEEHQNWIELSSVQLGGANPPGDRQGSLASVSEIVVTKQLDDSSVKLMVACTSGRPLTGGQIDFVRSVDGRFRVYLSYRLDNTLVTSFNTSSDGDSRPSESLSLNFTRLAVVLSHFNPDGTVGAPEQGIWPGSR